MCAGLVGAISPGRAGPRATRLVETLRRPVPSRRTRSSEAFETIETRLAFALRVRLACLAAILGVVPPLDSVRRGRSVGTVHGCVATALGVAADVASLATHEAREAWPAARCVDSQRLVRIRSGRAIEANASIAVATHTTGLLGAEAGLSGINGEPAAARLDRSDGASRTKVLWRAAGDGFLGAERAVPSRGAEILAGRRERVFPEESRRAQMPDAIDAVRAGRAGALRGSRRLAAADRVESGQGERRGCRALGAEDRSVAAG